MVTTNLDGFSLVNCRRFAKIAKLSPRQTFLLYGILQWQVQRYKLSPHPMVLQHELFEHKIHHDCWNKD